LGKYTGRTYPISTARKTLGLEADLELDQLIGSAISNGDFMFGLYILLYLLIEWLCMYE
jgi:hypothetical protein